MVEFLSIQKEEARRDLADDHNFIKKSVYYFELRVSSEVASKVGNSTGSFFVPLILNPTGYGMDEPFKIEKTYTQGGGLYIEENGIVDRMIHIQGHTGFRPRSFNGDASVGAVALSNNPSHSRYLSSTVITALSGHKHFMYLQDAVFRAYADLKRDPNTSEDTKLFFHNPRDLESWQVAPENFKLDRSADKRFLYEYSIELLVLASANAADADFSEDKDLLDAMRDGVAMAKSYVDQATGFINDVVATVDEITRAIKTVAGVVGSIGEIIGGVEDFLSGVKELVESPLAFVDAVTGVVDDVTSLISTTASFQDIPASYTNSWRKMSQSLDRLKATPELFEKDPQKVLKEMRKAQGLTTASNRAKANEAAGATAPLTIREFDTRGTEPLPGEIDREKGELGSGSALNHYTASKEITIGQGDTLASLAAKHLGDARLWQDIALLNGMKPPYIVAQADATLASPDNPIPGVVGIGEKIQIPTFGRAPKNQNLLPVLGVSQEAPYADQVLGTDYLLEPTSGREDLFDWVVDVAGGSVDFRKVSGFANLGQGLKTRLTTEKGHNVLYKKLGKRRLVGTNQVDVGQQLSRFFIAAAVTEDPRVASVRKVQITNSAADVLETDVDVVPVGFSQALGVKAIGVG